MLHQVAQIAGAEEAFDAVKQGVVVLVPADAVAAHEGLGEPVGDAPRCQRGLEGTDEEGRAVRVGKRHRLLGRQGVMAAVGQVAHVAGGGLSVEPLAHVALADAGAGGELRGAERPVRGQRAVEAELVTDQHQGCDRHGAEIHHDAAQQFVEQVFVDRAASGRGVAGLGIFDLGVFDLVFVDLDVVDLGAAGQAVIESGVHGKLRDG